MLKVRIIIKIRDRSNLHYSQIIVGLFYHHDHQQVTSKNDWNFIQRIVTHRDIYPWTALSRKWFAQRTQARFRHHFRDALPTTKCLGE